jgi:hypothetical protein
MKAGGGDSGAGEASDDGPLMERGVERRGERRDVFGERATLLFGRAAIDCTVLDMSSNGARVRLNSPAIVPEQLILRLHHGEAFMARRLWSLREQIGLLFNSAAPLNRGSAPVALSALEALPAGGLDPCLRVLRGAGFLNNLALSEAARDAEAAYARFRKLLGGLVNPVG